MEPQPSIFSGQVARRGTVWHGPALLATAQIELFGWAGVYSVASVWSPGRRPLSIGADAYEDHYIGEAVDAGLALTTEPRRTCWEDEAAGRPLLVFFRAVEGGAGATMLRRRLVALCLRSGVPPCNRPR